MKSGLSDWKTVALPCGIKEALQLKGSSTYLQPRGGAVVL